jgi:hypothetical protein
MYGSSYMFRHYIAIFRECLLRDAQLKSSQQNILDRREWIIGVFVGFSGKCLLGILIFEGLAARRLYRSLGVKGLINPIQAWTDPTALGGWASQNF